jgi:predicted GNAT family N-acyltransferase
MTQQHPITPPPELVQQWINEEDGLSAEHIATRAAQWGADQELEACLRLVEIDAGEDAYDFARYIRAARRPKPQSLKEQAMQALCRFMASEGHEDCTEEEVADDFTTIRRALEALPE